MVLGAMATCMGSALAVEIASAASAPAPSPAFESAPADAASVKADDAAARWSARSSLSDGSLRSNLARGKLDLGVTFDSPVRALRSGDAPIDPVLAYGMPAPTLSIGLRSVPIGSVAPASSLIDRATGTTLGDVPERKFGLEWKPQPSRLFINRGIGIRLDGDDRVTMRLRKGSLGLFMKTVF